MDDIEKLSQALADIQTAQNILADAGRAIFDTCQCERERQAIWKQFEQTKKLWHRLNARRQDLYHRRERAAVAGSR